MHRLREVVDQCADAVRHGYEEEGLLHDTCRLLVDETGYAMVWLGRLEADRKGIVPVAHAGMVPDFVPLTKQITRKATPLEQCIDRKGPVAARRILSAAAWAHLAPHARRYAYGSLCSIPLRLDAGHAGVLNVHATDPDAFDGPEIALLRELAAVLEQAVGNNEKRAMRRDQEDSATGSSDGYAGLFDGAREGIFLASPWGTLKMVNPAFARLLGYESSEKLLSDRSVTLYTIMKPADKNRLMGSLDGGMRPPLEMDLRGKDSRPVRVSVIASAVDTEEGRCVKAFVQKMRADDRPATSAHRAALPRPLARQIKHDLDDAVTVILNQVELARRARTQDTMDVDPLDVIDRRARGLVHLTRDLVDALQAGDPAAPGWRQGDRVERLINDAVRSVQGTVRRHQVAVDGVPGPATTAKVDHPGADKVMTMLLDEAVRQASPGGTVRVQAKEQDNSVHVLIERHHTNGHNNPGPSAPPTNEAPRLDLARRILERNGATLRIDHERPDEARAAIHVELPKRPPQESPDENDQGGSGRRRPPQARRRTQRPDV